MQSQFWKHHLIIGLLATGALTGLLFFLSSFTPVSFVPLDIADALIRLTPGAVATTGIETLGPLAKLLVELSGSVLFIAVGGAVAVLYGRIAPRPMLLAGTLLACIPALLTILIQLVSGGLRGGPRGLVITALLYLTWGMVVVWMINRLSQPASISGSPSEETARRTFLFRSGGALLTVAVGSTAIAELLRRAGSGTQLEGAGQALPTRAVAQAPAAQAPSPPTSIPPTQTSETMSIASTEVVVSPTVEPTPQPSATPVPMFEPAPGTRSPFNTNETLYVISSATRDPQVAREQWSLEVGGAVHEPFTLTYDDLLAMPRIDQISTLECISNEVGNYLIGNVTWSGVRLRDLLEQAGVQEGVIDIKLTAAEGYTESIPLAKAMEPTTLIAYGIDGEALAVKHGFPARLIVPGLYGEKNVKWLTRIEPVREDYQGYWQQRGWTDDATITTTAVIDTGNPRLSKEPLRRENGVVPLGGIAFAGNRGITKVEIKIDAGTWEEAVLDPQDDPLTWRFWRYDWPVEPGTYTLAVRATDGAGEVQADEVRDTHPDGATGYHTFMLEVR